nr:hypothetical protein [Oryza sativa Japonica Group]BAD09719.1 hypothetical protein [Oryza sativa Japonica Group]
MPTCRVMRWCENGANNVHEDQELNCMWSAARSSRIASKSIFLLMDKALKSEIEGVEEIESCFIAPSEDTPRQGLWLSPLDIVLANRGHTPNVYFYRRDVVAASGNTDFFEVGRIKEAMARALVAFYPLAGRLHVDGGSRPKIECNAEGALFVVAPYLPRSSPSLCTSL